MRSRTARFLLVVALTSTTAHAQRFFDELAIGFIGSSIGESLGSAAASLIDAQSETAALSARVARERARFWASRGTDAEAAAAAAFAAALFEKDLFYFALAVPNGVHGNLAGMPMLVGGIDGGIADIGRVEFGWWVNAVRERLGARDHGSDNPLDRRPGEPVLPTAAALQRAMDATADDYATYRAVRDWGEYLKAGRDQDFYRDARSLAAFASWLSTHDDAKAAAMLQAQIDAFGRDALLAAAEQVRSAPKDAVGTITSGPLAGEPITRALPRALASASPKGYALYAIADQSPVDAEASSRYAEAVALWGEPALLEVAAAVRQMPTVQNSRVARYNGYLLTRTHPNDGVGNSAPISMIRETLHSDYPRLSQQAPSAFWVSRAGVQEAIDAAEALRVAELPAMLANTCQLSQELWNSSLDIREYLDGTRSYDGWDTMVMDVVMYPPDYIESQLNCLRTWADTHGLLPALAQYDCRANKMIVLQGRADEICPRLKTPDGVAPRTEEAAR